MKKCSWFLACTQNLIMKRSSIVWHYYYLLCKFIIANLFISIDQFDWTSWHVLEIIFVNLMKKAFLSVWKGLNNNENWENTKDFLTQNILNLLVPILYISMVKLSHAELHHTHTSYDNCLVDRNPDSIKLLSSLLVHVQ